ncbi:squalene-hopene cyclase [Bacillus sp. JCM 19045]|nr:squalene-hopene cyclase [Bacillus sp. JCM 19045]
MNRSEGMAYLINKLREDQTSSGSWEYPFEAGTFTDAYMIILLRTLERNDEALIDELAERLMSRQETNGAWKLFPDDSNGNVTTTVEAYYALLYSGNYDVEDERLRKAKQFIVDNGGIEKTTLLTKMMLMFTGQYKWPRFFPLPIEIILLPLAFPVNLYSMSVYGRAHMVPFLIAADQKVSIKTEMSPDLTQLYSGAREDVFSDWLSRRIHGSCAYRFWQASKNTPVAQVTCMDWL